MKLGEEFETERQPMEMEQYFCDDRLSPQMCVCWVAFIAFHFGVLPAALCQNDVTCLNEDSECQEQKERKKILFSKCNFCFFRANWSMRTQSDKK